MRDNSAPVHVLQWIPLIVSRRREHSEVKTSPDSPTCLLSMKSLYLKKIPICAASLLHFYLQSAALK